MNAFASCKNIMLKICIDFLFKPVHPAGLAITRILFGLLMLFDIPDERGGAVIDIRWGDPKSCNFPLFSFMPRPSFPTMCIIYGIMFLGALGICLGYKFHMSCLAYLLPYWYILLLDKTFWNNHSYLYGLLASLLSVSQAGKYWSLDSHLDKCRGKPDIDAEIVVPYWNYFLLRFQIFCLYFFAGLKKMNMEWLEGYSMSNVGKHWVFQPLGLLFTTKQIDYLVIHISGFLMDLTIGFFLLYNRTRPLAMLICGMFHWVNSRLFNIGLFPYVCIVTMPIFCDPDWPVNTIKSIKNLTNKVRYGSANQINEEETQQQNKSIKGPYSTSNPSKLILSLISIYCFLQLFLPWSHFITKGYNNWTNGIYGYSWDMMVHSWDTTLVVVRIVDNKNGEEIFLDPSAWVHNDRWNKHGDMTIQYAQCVRANAVNMNRRALSDNLSIYLDVWCSLNGRFQQRMFNPHYDLLKADWSPFVSVEWLLPVLYEYSDFREKMKAIQEHVYSWSNYSEVLFIADFPDLYLENFISDEIGNISLAIIEGAVLLEIEDTPNSVILKQGDNISLAANEFHKITTVSKTPSCFMYVYENTTKIELQQVQPDQNGRSNSKSPFPILESGLESMESFTKMFELISNALLHILYDVPLVLRTHVD